MFRGGSWAPLSGSAGESAFAMLGVNATADTVNRLAVKSGATLFDHDGGDHRLKINKAAAGDTATIAFQTAYSGRAEIGLAGDGDWRIKASPDGSTWRDGLVVRSATGRFELPGNAEAKTRALVDGRVLVTGGGFDVSDGTPAGVAIGYDTANDYGWIGAIHTGIAQKTLAIQPFGGAITLGAPAAANMASAGGATGFNHASSGNDARIDVTATSGAGFAAIFARNAALSAGQVLSLNRYGGGVAVHKTAVTSGFALDVSGDVRCTSLAQTSDGALKRVLGPSLGLDFILKLKPVTYRWRTGTESGGEETASAAGPGRPHQGLIAQDVAAAAEELHVDFGGYKDIARREPDAEREHLLDYAQFVAPLVRAVQQLADRLERLEAGTA